VREVRPWTVRQAASITRQVFPRSAAAIRRGDSAPPSPAAASGASTTRDSAGSERLAIECAATWTIS
jgi:hypothetical protein